MRAPDVGDQFVSVRHSILGKDVTWRVMRIDRKADAIERRALVIALGDVGELDDHCGAIHLMQ